LRVVIPLETAAISLETAADSSVLVTGTLDIVAISHETPAGSSVLVTGTLVSVVRSSVSVVGASVSVVGTLILRGPQHYRLTSVSNKTGNIVRTCRPIARLGGWLVLVFGRFRIYSNLKYLIIPF
jgi:hypothetical protein